MRKSNFEIVVANRLSIFKFPFEEEYKFCESRRWRFDFAYPKYKIAIECEGGVFSGGRHTRGLGFIKDCEKYNAATMLGWKVFRYTPQMIDEIIPDLQRCLVSKISYEK